MGLSLLGLNLSGSNNYKAKRMLTDPLYEAVNECCNGCLGSYQLWFDTIATYGFGGLLTKDCDGKLLQKLCQLVDL